MLLVEKKREDVPLLRRNPVDAETLSKTAVILEDVRSEGEEALRRYAAKFGDWNPDQKLIWYKDDLLEVFRSMPQEDQDLLVRCAERVQRFAEAQRACLTETKVAIPGGFAGQSVAPMEKAGCYAPGGRFPLPSSVLMTVVTARVAGVTEVWVASPKPAPITLAAAAVAGADALLAVGGAQAIAAMALGAGPVPACDAIVGPGNRWVTAAKQLVAGHVAIDMLAGPSELVILADASAEPDVVAADLLAQAEHDTDALPVLITTSRELVSAVNEALERQLAVLPTRPTASEALKNGFVVCVDSLDEAMTLCDQMAPEHLQVMTENAAEIAPKLRHYGGLFVGSGTAEVLGDYCAGPNHTLPTGGTARSAGGLCVNHFLRVRTWMQIDDASQSQELVQDAVALARHEGLEAHARAAEQRLV